MASSLIALIFLWPQQKLWFDTDRGILLVVSQDLILTISEISTQRWNRSWDFWRRVCFLFKEEMNSHALLQHAVDSQPEIHVLWTLHRRVSRSHLLISWPQPRYHHFQVHRIPPCWCHQMFSASSRREG